MRTLLLAVLVVAASARADERLLSAEASVGPAYLREGFSARGPTRANDTLGEFLTGRYLFHGWTAEGDVLATEGLEPDTVSPGASFTARVGYSGRRWAVTVGPSFQWTSGARPALQIFPSLRADLGVGPTVLSLGVFDFHALALAHLSVAFHGYSLGYVAPLGGQASGTWAVSDRFAVRAQVLGFQAFNSTVLFASAALVLR